MPGACGDERRAECAGDWAPHVGASAQTCGAGSSCGAAHDRLQLEELLEAVLAPLTAVPRLLVAAEGRGEVGSGAVQVDVAGAQTRGDAQRVVLIAGRHVAREPVGR